MVSAEIHVEPANDDGHRGVCTTCDKEKGSVLELRIVVDGNENSKADNGNANGADGKSESMPRLVRQESDAHREAERHCPGRNTVQLRLDGRVAVGLEDAWRKIGVSVSRDDETKVHEAAEDDLVILENVADVLDRNAPFNAGAALVCLETRRNVDLLFWCEPLGFLGEVRQQEVEKEADENREAAFYDEDPAPALVTSQSVHLADRGGKQATKSTGESSAVKEEGVSSLGLVAAVPHANEVEC